MSLYYILHFLIGTRLVSYAGIMLVTLHASSEVFTALNSYISDD